MDGFIRVHHETRYLVLFGSERYDSIYNRITYLISVKSGIAYTVSHNYAKIKVDSCDSLPLKNNDFHDVKSVFNKDKNNCYYNIFLGKAFYEFPKSFMKYKWYIMIELTFLKELMLIRKVNQKRAIFATIGIF